MIDRKSEGEELRRVVVTVVNWRLFELLATVLKTSRSTMFRDFHCLAIPSYYGVSSSLIKDHICRYSCAFALQLYVHHDQTRRSHLLYNLETFEASS